MTGTTFYIGLMVYKNNYKKQLLFYHNYCNCVVYYLGAWVVGTDFMYGIFGFHIVIVCKICVPRCDNICKILRSIITNDRTIIRLGILVL